MLSRATLLAASVLIALSATAFAQGAAGDGKISPTTTPSAPTAPMVDRNPNVAGATGDAKVPGDPSTMAGDRKATVEQRTGQDSSDGGGD